MAENPNVHPAAKGFSKTWETIKYVGGKALKWAAYGAIALGAASLVFAPVAAFLGGIGSFFTGSSLGVGAASGILSSILPGLTVGAIVGAVFGGVKGVAGAGEAVEEKWQDRMADYENNEARIQRNQALGAARAPVPERSGGVLSNLFGGPSQGQGMGR